MQIDPEKLPCATADMVEEGIAVYEDWLNDPYEQAASNRVANLVDRIYRYMELRRITRDMDRDAA